VTGRGEQAVPMPEPVARFTGSIPAAYDHYLGPVLFEPYAVAIAERAAELAPTRVLEIACGTGRLTYHLRRALPDTTAIVATDLNAPMIDVARAKVTGPMTWLTADALALPFDDGSFDLVICQFGVMFFPDRVAAYREMHRVLQPGGTTLITTWGSIDENPHARSIAAGVEATAPGAEAFLDTPHGYHDRRRLVDDAVAGGLVDVTLEELGLPLEAPSAAWLATGFTTGSPLANLLAERDAATPAVHAEVTRRIARSHGHEPARGLQHAIIVRGARA
jgi:SAM-dependent methyltransferase